MNILNFFKRKNNSEIVSVPKKPIIPQTAYTLQMKAFYGDDQNKLMEMTNLFARSYISRDIDLRILTSSDDVSMQSVRTKATKLIWISTVKYVTVATSRPLSEIFTVRMEVVKDNSLDMVLNKMNKFAIGVEAINLEIKQTPQQYLRNTKEVQWYGYITYKIGPQ